MNIALWVLQVLLALHTTMGALWKFSNPEQAVPTLQMIPHGVWLGLSAVELVCAAVLILPGFVKPLARAVPFAAGFIVAEMLLFTALHLASGAKEYGSVAYWLVVAALCAFLAYGRGVLKPL